MTKKIEVLKCKGWTDAPCKAKFVPERGFVPPFNRIGEGLLTDAQIKEHVRCGTCAQRCFQKLGLQRLFPLLPALAEMERRRVKAEQEAKWQARGRRLIIEQQEAQRLANEQLQVAQRKLEAQQRQRQGWNQHFSKRREKSLTDNQKRLKKIRGPVQVDAVQAEV